jgi:hypothetical protein
MLKLNKNGLKVHQLLLTSAALWGQCTSGSALNIWNKFGKIFHLSRDKKCLPMAMLQERAVSVEGDTTMASQKATSRRHENNVLIPKEH